MLRRPPDYQPCPGAGKPPSEVYKVADFRPSNIGYPIGNYGKGVCPRCGKVVPVRRNGLTHKHAPLLPLYELISWRAS